MPHSIFFSWQADTPARSGRNLIEWALNRAIRLLKADADIDPADRELHVDHDTANVPGSPPLVETIFGKIDEATAFVSDLSFVGQRGDGRRMPNPNVLLEHGWALRGLTWRRIVSVMNTADGDPAEHDLPFDLQHFRRPILYHCPADATNAVRAVAREGLAQELVKALKGVLTDEAARPGIAAAPHPHDVTLLAQVRRQFPGPVRLFVRKFNFGDRFPRRMIEPFGEMNGDWAGAEFEFEDGAVQAAFAQFRVQAETFGELIARHSFALDANPDIAWVRTDLDRQAITPETERAIAQINEAASAVSDALDAFERIARARIPVAAPAVDAQAANDPREAQAAEALAELQHGYVRGDIPALVSRPRYLLRLVPFAAMEGRRLDPRRVAQMLPMFPPDPAHRIEQGSDARQWWVNAVPGPTTDLNPETRWLMRLVRPGTIEFSATAGFRVDDDREIVIDGRALEIEIVAHFARMAEILAAIGFAGPALAEIGFDGIEDMLLARSRPGGRRIRTPQLRLPVVRVEGLAQPIATVLHEPFDMLWQSAGWPDGSPSFDSGTWSPAPEH